MSEALTCRSRKLHAPDAGWQLDDPEQALRVVEVLPKLPAVAALDWPRGKPLRVVSVDSPALGLQVLKQAVGRVLARTILQPQTAPWCVQARTRLL
jgi:hypothetical protein